MPRFHIDVNSERIVNLFTELVRIDSETLGERLMADTLKRKLRELARDTGMEISVEEDDAGQPHGGTAGNILAFVKGTADGPALLLSAHMDRVPPGKGVKPVIEYSDGCDEIENAVIRSEGATILGADDVGGIVSILEGLRTLAENGYEYPNITVTFTIAEEGGLRGAKGLDKTKIRADAAFVFDAAGEVGTIITGAPHQVRLYITVHGKSAHAGIKPEDGINAIVVAADAVERIRFGRVDDITTSNVGTFHSGSATNIVPELAKLECEVRSHDRKRLDEQVALIDRALSDACDRYGASYELDVEETYPGYEFAPEDKPIVLAAEAVRALGDCPKYTMTGGGSDANILNSIGVPAVALGMGFDNAHSTRESVRVSQLLKSTALVVSLVIISRKLYF